MVGDHTRQQESIMFTAMHHNMFDDERRQMAKQFKQSKQKLQNQM